MIDFEKHRSDKIEYIYNQNDINLDFQKHTHRSFEISFVYEGVLKCEVEGQIFELNSGQGIMILPGQIHSYKTENYCKSYLCVFSNDWINEFYKKIKGYHFENPVFNFKDDLVCRVLQDGQSDKFLIKSVLYGICSQVFKHSKMLKINESDFMLINSLAFYIQDNYRNNISLKDISKDMGYSYCYLSSFFNANFGMGFSCYVNNYRTELAKEYLNQTDKDIAEISLLCGFETVRNFNRIFKSKTGMTPREFRIKRILKATEV